MCQVHVIKGTTCSIAPGTASAGRDASMMQTAQATNRALLVILPKQTLHWADARHTY